VSVLPEDIASALDVMGRWRPDVAVDVRWFDTISSTMDEAASLAASGVPGGLVVGADEQTAGRGRRGHSWHSAPGAGLYFSWLCRPSLDASALSLVTLAAGVGVHRGLRQATGLTTDLKWPNDLLVGGRKVAGILAEGCALGSPHQAVIVGVGVNLRQTVYPPDVAARATSIEVELGRPSERGQVLVEIVCGLTDAVAAVESDRDGILQAWREAAPSVVGASVEWTDMNGTYRGSAAGIDDSGALLIQTADSLERVVAGVVRWLSSSEPFDSPRTPQASRATRSGQAANSE
jgi:BirA family transcriptional regulator, biotin operon repressor / biotin---[acetyl-CoA-carboxylase] ligase